MLPEMLVAPNGETAPRDQILEIFHSILSSFDDEKATQEFREEFIERILVAFMKNAPVEEFDRMIIEVAEKYGFTIEEITDLCFMIILNLEMLLYAK